MKPNLETTQRQLCDKYGVEFCPVDPYSKLGFAMRTQGKIPINGVRLRPAVGTNGWFIWCGTETSEDADFYAPLHAAHLLERCSEAMPFLGLPPGYRFLTSGDYVDVWFDAAVLENS
jgi:hypothetical protein